MKTFILFGLLFGTFACSEMSKGGSQNDGFDGCVLEIPPHILEKEQVERLKKVLSSPIDLAAYKSEYGPSNSGAGEDKTLYNTPEADGFTYQYMLFQSLTSKIKPKPTEGDLFHGFRITSYIFGSEIPEYSDTNEVVLEITCKLNNPTLGVLNVYGKSSKQVVFDFGEPQFKLNEHYIYQDSLNNTFTIHFQNDVVDWYKFIKLNPRFNLTTEIPAHILSFD